MSDLELLLLALVVVYCVMPVALFVVAVALVRRAVGRITAPDIDRIEAQFAALRARYPDDTTEQAIRRVIRQQAIRCGILGAITGAGGFFTLIIGLPVDVLLSMRIQATLVQFIATAYGHADVSEAELRARQYLIMSGGARVAQTANRVALRFAVRFVSKSLAKLVPIIGAVISFAINYALTQATGRLAQQWYAGQIALPGFGARPTPSNR